MKNPFLRLFHARDKPRRKPSLTDSVSDAPTFYFFGGSNAGKSVNVNSAVQLSTVYACIRVIAETIARLPLNVFETTDQGNIKPIDHPLQRLPHDEPNTEMTSFVWREDMLSHLLYQNILRSLCTIIRTDSGERKIPVVAYRSRVKKPRSLFGWLSCLW